MLGVVSLISTCRSICLADLSGGMEGATSRLEGVRTVGKGIMFKVEAVYTDVEGCPSRMDKCVV